ncbi:hypothetical protein E2C01_034701 [Portunus trituberculatus]|uniref:Uncharacterized protein n=1 Tax=Portunus trituberculatus TaxID=210409 RepID=A0A5B7F7M2_PORTR|nr:hypothetical protein [Portunus trituberculatus]
MELRGSPPQLTGLRRKLAKHRTFPDLLQRYYSFAAGSVLTENVGNSKKEQPKGGQNHCSEKSVDFIMGIFPHYAKNTHFQRTSCSPPETQYSHLYPSLFGVVVVGESMGIKWNYTPAFSPALDLPTPKVLNRVAWI